MMFYKIHHEWRTNSPVSMDPIVFCLCGMNISCWSHMSDLHQKTVFSYYRNIIFCHLSGPYVSSAWDEFFLDETQKGVRMGFEPATSWSSEALTTGQLLQLCCCPVSMEMGVKPATCQVPLLRNESDPHVSCSCTESNRTHLSVLVELNAPHVRSHCSEMSQTHLLVLVALKVIEPICQF
jgi:hypothetical protein